MAGVAGHERPDGSGEHVPGVELPAQSFIDAPTASTPPPARRRRLVAGVAAGALLLGGTSAGIGYGLNRTSTSDLGSVSAGTAGGVDRGPRSGTVPDGVGPDWSARPFTAPGVPEQDPSQNGLPDSRYGVSTDKATASQLTGLVRIVSTLGYDGAEAIGTGMVLTSDGTVVTNHHVVEGATKVRATVMSSGRTYTVRVVGTDAKADIAVLRLVGASGLGQVAVDAGGVTHGEKVTAVGDGNGTVHYLSAAAGTVLAQRQTITTQSSGSATGEQLQGLMEISSDVISGYSGGATYDSDGEVVGMTTAASSGGDIVGYAIPVRTVLRVVHDIDNRVQAARYHYAYTAFLGIGLTEGTVVREVYDGTPAAAAEIGVGDRITAVGGVPVSTATRLRAAIAAHSPGDLVPVTWTDEAGASGTATIRLARGPLA
jgi:S1-C subfamily serine protease